MSRVAIKSHFGFSFIELIIVISTIGLLAVLSTVSFKNFNNHEAPTKDADKVAAVIEEARILSQSSKNGSVFGVHFENSKAVRFKGQTYSASNSENVPEPLNSLVQLSVISLNGGSVDAVFSRLGGTTTSFGTLTFALRADAAQTKTITIYKTGLIEISK